MSCSTVIAGDSTTACISDQDAATLGVIADGLVLASQGLAPDKRMLINFPRQLLLDDAAFALPSQQCVVEVLEDVDPDPEVLEALSRLKKAGYKLAMDDYAGEEKFEPFLRIVDFVKVDIPQLDTARIKDVAANLQRYGNVLLAEKVETLKVFELTRSLGFTLFQGYFFCRPEVLSGKKISTSRIAKVQLLRELSRDDFEVADLSRFIGADMSLSYRLLRYINSASFSLPNKIESIQQAVVLLGRKQLAQWLRVVVMADLSSNSLTSELAYTSAKRARFLELIGENEPGVRHLPESMFLLGLFSLLDAMMGTSMEKLLEELPLEDELVQALAGESNSMRHWLDMVIELEMGNWLNLDNLLADHGLDPSHAARYHAEAMAWTGQIFGSIF